MKCAGFWRQDSLFAARDRPCTSQAECRLLESREGVGKEHEMVGGESADLTSKAEEGDGSEGGEESEVERRTVQVRALDVDRVEE